MEKRTIEIMAPVGSYESLMAAIQGGAGSVYFGVENLNMRSRSSNNFNLDDLRNIVRIAVENKVRIFQERSPVSPPLGAHRAGFEIRYFI